MEINKNILDLLKKTLSVDQSLITDEGKFKKWVAIGKVRHLDEGLIGLLLNEPQLKQTFFKNIKGHLVFNTELFLLFLEQKNFINDSYTEFKNIINLTANGKSLKERNEVSLVWPFKDCVLEGGQTKEERGRKEIFFNQILAQDEITQLFEPKVFTNAYRYSTEGDTSLQSFKRDNKGTITDNLVIKGNNLLALHTLHQQFKRKVKLIYIDPPYNTGKDGFQYNDKFNHAAWLTFMRNRLVIAKKLLKKEGLICIQIDDKEHHYLRVLCDEIFGRENFIVNIIWKKRGGPPNDKKIGTIHENIICYAKELAKCNLFQKDRTEKQLKRYTNPDRHPKGAWSSDNLMANVKGGRYSKALYFPIINPNTGEEHYPSSNGNWRFSKAKIQGLLDNNEIYFGKDGKGRPKLKRFLVDLNGGMPFSSMWYDTPQNNKATAEIQNLFGSVNDFDTPKPEGLMEKILEFSTTNNDIVLDFFAGSGTTAAVVHKMNRQYITIEQMDYIHTITVERLKKVIGISKTKNGELHKLLDFDRGGISKSVKWQGGGEFVYMELKQYNETFVEKIQMATTSTDLKTIWEQMKTRSFLDYNIDIKTLEAEENTLFALPFHEQQAVLIELLDKNQLYVNLSNMEDTEMETTAIEKAITRDFYQISIK